MVGLNLAIHKSEAIVFTNRRTHNDITIITSGTPVLAASSTWAIFLEGNLILPITYGHLQLRQTMLYKKLGRFSLT